MEFLPSQPIPHYLLRAQADTRCSVNINNDRDDDFSFIRIKSVCIFIMDC